jgi:hypothetical protein
MMLHLPGLTPVQIIANPAVTIGRAFTDTFVGIAPASVPGFLLAQLAALALLAVLHPRAATAASDLVIPADTAGYAGFSGPSHAGTTHATRKD